MKNILLLISILISSVLIAQPPVEIDVFQKTATATTTQIGVRVRATTTPVDYIGVTFYILYQSANAAPQNTSQNTGVGIDDSKMVTAFAWGSSARATNPQQIITNVDPAPAGGNLFNRRFIYANIDENGGASVQTLINSRWDTLLYITLNTLQPTYPQGGYAYIQKTSEALGASLSDPSFANIPISVFSGERPLGLNVAPVTYTSFNAGCTDKGALVKWTTGTEMNSDYFELQRSNKDGNEWSTVNKVKVKAKGNSTTETNYEQMDQLGGAALYRLKQYDLDGTFHYSNIIRTNCADRNIEIVIYPVPARDVLNIVVRTDKAVKTQLEIYDASGRLVKKINTAIISGNNNIPVSLLGLANGQYVIRSTDPLLPLNKKFTIMH